MRITTKYNLEDKVYKIGRERPKVWVLCGFCDATGSITGRNGDIAICMKCYGNKGEYEPQQKEWKVKEERLTIGYISYEVRSDLPGGDPDWTRYVGKIREQCMCRETGVGGGIVHHVDTLWPTEEDAQAECDRRNKEE